MADAVPKVAIACQGGGTHAAFEVGVLSEILKDIHDRNRFELVGLSGTSAGALCALMVWYGLAPKNGRAGSARLRSRSSTASGTRLRPPRRPR